VSGESSISLIAFRRTAGSRYRDQPECFIPFRTRSWSPGQDATLPHGSWPTLTASTSPEAVGDQQRLPARLQGAGRVRVRRAEGGRERVPPERHPADGPTGRHRDRGGRGGAALAQRDPAS
jgi:hypothetical protein